MGVIEVLTDLSELGTTEDVWCTMSSKTTNRKRKKIVNNKDIKYAGGCKATEKQLAYILSLCEYSGLILRETTMTKSEASQMIDYFVNGKECPGCYDRYIMSLWK